MSSDRFVPTDVPDLIRDRKSGAILNTNRTALAEHRARVKRLQKNQTDAEQLNKVSEEVSQLRGELDAIKSLLQALVMKQG